MEWYTGKLWGGRWRRCRSSWGDIRPTGWTCTRCVRRDSEHHGNQHGGSERKSRYFHSENPEHGRWFRLWTTEQSQERAAKCKGCGRKCVRDDKECHHGGSHGYKRGHQRSRFHHYVAVPVHLGELQGGCHRGMGGNTGKGSDRNHGGAGDHFTNHDRH